MFKKVLSFLKLCFDFVIWGGIELIIGNVIEATMPKRASTFERGVANAGGMVLSTYISSKVINYVDSEIEEGKKTIKEAVEEAKKQEK